jgi:hypothetical protein
MLPTTASRVLYPPVCASCLGCKTSPTLSTISLGRLQRVPLFQLVEGLWPTVARTASLARLINDLPGNVLQKLLAL